MMLFRKHIVHVAFLAGIAITAGAQKLPPAIGAGEVNLYARLLAMADTRQLDTALIDRGLASKWRPLRAAATIAIGQIGTEHGGVGIPRLRALLKDRDLTVGGNAAYALGLLRDTASIADLGAALALNHAVAREAAWALGEIGAPARARIIAGLKGEHDHDTEIQLLLAAAKLRPVPVAEIKPFLRVGDPSVVWIASYAIARTRSPAGVRDLIELEASPALAARPQNPGASTEMMLGPYTDAVSGAQRTRAEIARGIAKSAAGDSLGVRAFAVLARLVADVSPHVRINAIRSLGTYGAPAKPALIYAAHDYDPNVRIAAAQSLGTVLSKGATEFPGLWTADTSLAYRSALLASAALAGLRPPELGQWATSADWQYRAAVAAAAGDTLDRAFAISRSVPPVRDPDPRVREAAYAAIAPTAGMPL